MKLLFRTIFVTALLLASVGMLHAQHLNQKISVEFNNVPLEEVLRELSRQSGILFSYNAASLPLDRKIVYRASEKNIETILDEILKPLNIARIQREQQVILKPSKAMKEENATAAVQKYTLSGFLRDEKTGEALIGANVYDKSSYTGTTTNAYGFFSITLAEGHYDITFSLLGYAATSLALNLNSNRSLNIKLNETGIDMKAVEIKGGQDEKEITAGNAGEVRLTAAALKRMAGFAGNIDVIRSLQAVPGINTFGDGSSFYYVRGGNNDQNLMLIDEAPIFNPAHLFGFFSALAPDAIKDVRAFKGDFPASYGGRLSSVIDIRARDGNINRPGFSGNLGIYTSDLTVEGPIQKEKSSFILSARKSNLNWLNSEEIFNKSITIDFYDLNAKFNIRINDKNRLFLTGFTGRDEFSRITGSSVNTFGISWNNTTGTIRWNHLFSNRLFSNTTAVFSQYNYYLYISREQDDYWLSSVRNRTLKTDFTFYMNPANTIRAGAEISGNHSNPGNVHFSDEDTQKSAPVIPEYNSMGLSVYLSNDQMIGDRLLLRYGLRLSSWRNTGPATVYFYDAAYQVIDTVTVSKGSYFTPYYRPEPRLSLSWRIGRESTLTAGYTRTAQYLQMLSNSTSPFTSLEVWAPSGPNIRPQTADQFTACFLTRFNGNPVQLSVETFYKKFHNQIDYKDHANMLYNPFIEGELRFGTARSYGVELLLKKSSGKLAGWLGYAYTRILKTMEDLNNGLEFPAIYDRPHSLFTNLTWKAASFVDISASWFYMSGSAYTSPTGFMSFNGYTVPVYGARNNSRLPDYHRMDVSISFRLNKPENRYKHNIVLSFYNLYAHKNPFAFAFNKIMNDKGEFVVPSDLDGSYEVIPTSISVAGLIPALNYTFRF